MSTSHHVLTKQDIVAIRQADEICISRNHVAGMPTYVELIRKFPVTDTNPYAHESRYVLPAPVDIGHQYESDQDREALRCWSHVYVYRGQSTEVNSILSVLKAGDEIRFVFEPDYHTNGSLAKLGIHADCLILNVYRPGKTLRFVFDHETGPDNWSRMVRGAKYCGWLMRYANGELV